MRVSAVSFLNTWPLVWGFLEGPQRGLYDFRFDLPAQCADALGSGAADIGIVPCAELDRLGLDYLPDTLLLRNADRRSKPVMEEMLAVSDACLIIGDPALAIEPADLPYECLDLGTEWTAWTGLPMVFAVWAGKKQFLTPDVAKAFVDSCAYGMSHVDEMVARATAERGFRADLVRQYFTHYIQYDLTPRHIEGLELFRSYVRKL